MNQGARETIYSEFLRDCMDFTGVNYEEYRLRMKAGTKDAPSEFTRLARCDPLGIAQVVRKGVGLNLVYGAEFMIPTEIPVGRFIFSPNRSAIRYGNKTIFSAGIIALLSDVVRKSDFHVPDEKQQVVTDVALSAIQRGKEEMSLTPIAVCATDGFQLILKKDSLLSSRLHVSISQGPLFNHPNNLRKAISDFGLDVESVLETYAEEGILTRANESRNERKLCRSCVSDRFVSVSRVQERLCEAPS